MLSLATLTCVGIRAAVAAKLSIAGILLRGEYSDLSQVSLEVRPTYLCLEQSDLIEGTGHQIWCHGLCGEKPVEFAFLLDQRAA